MSANRLGRHLYLHVIQTYSHSNLQLLIQNCRHLDLLIGVFRFAVKQTLQFTYLFGFAGTHTVIQSYSHVDFTGTQYVLVLNIAVYCTAVVNS